MAGTGEQHVAEILEDLACPACEYNLRGLRGDIVQCPECGHTCDVAQLIANRWRQPWHRAPKLNTVSAPVAWAVIGPIIGLTGLCIGLALVGRTMRVFESPIILVPLTLLMVGWCSAMWQSYRVFDDIRGIWLSLLSHAIYGGYVGGIGAVIIGGINLARGIYIRDGLVIAASSFVVMLAVPLVWLARRGEKYVARHCIRRYLQLQAAAES